MIDALTTLALLGAGAFFGGLGIRMVDMLRENMRVKSKRLDAVEAELATLRGDHTGAVQKLTEDQEALAKVHNGTVVGLQAHDRELTRVAIKLGIRRDDTAFSDVS